SRKSFYELRKRAVLDGPAAVLEPPTRRGVEPDQAQRRGQGTGDPGASGAGVLGTGPWPDQRPRQDAQDGLGLGALDRVVGPDLPPGRHRATRAEEETPLGVATVRLSGAERLLAVGRRRVRADRWAQVCDLP